MSCWWQRKHSQLTWPPLKRCVSNSFFFIIKYFSSASAVFLLLVRLLRTFFPSSLLLFFFHVTLDHAKLLRKKIVYVFVYIFLSFSFSFCFSRLSHFSFNQTVYAHTQTPYESNEQQQQQWHQHQQTVKETTHSTWGATESEFKLCFIHNLIVDRTNERQTTLRRFGDSVAVLQLHRGICIGQVG